MRFKPLPKVKVICWECGKEFGVQPYKKGKAKYCSNECKYSRIKRTMTHKWNTKPLRRRKLLINCLNCGKLFKVRIKHLNIIKFCCRECYLEDLKRNKGKNTKEVRLKEAEFQEKVQTSIWKINDPNFDETKATPVKEENLKEDYYEEYYEEEKTVPKQPANYEIWKLNKF